MCYYIDIYVGFTTNYINNYTGEAYYGPYKIAKHYVLHGSFFLDFLSTFRFELVIKTTNQNLLLFFKFLKLLKVMRLKKISKIIRGSHIDKEIKAISQVAYFTLILVIYTHLVACIMWWLLKTDKVWVPAVDFGSVYSEVFDQSDYRHEFDQFWYQYLTMWYNSALAFVLVEINPRTYTQICLMVIIYIFNAIVNAVLFGVFVDQFEIVRQKQKAQQKEIDESNTVMSNININERRTGKPVKKEVREYLIKTFTTKN